MKTKAEISKITITVAGQKLELTLDEARDLKKALNDALEPKVVFPYVPPVVIERPVYIPPYNPPYWDGPRRNLYDVWCESDNAARQLNQISCRNTLQITG